ncbi:Pleckstrin homology domain-containing protein [Flammula alnicola]|nr:Pleckstrin homology domain-containing protein [Flammula alnicola]
MVQFDHSSNDISSDSPPIAGPVPPEVVLQRTTSTVDPNTSLAATALVSDRSTRADDVRWDDTLKRDRMLVRVSYTKDEGITHFDDAVHRTTRNLHFEDWGEFLVAWRRDSLEIYKDHSTPGKEWITGHKELSYVIPLKSSRTKLSLYSFVDSTFCITCAPTTTQLNTATSRWVFSRTKEGTNIFVFKPKSRSRGYDWMWQLWRSQGGQIPTSVDIYNPGLSMKVKIDIPINMDVDNDALYRTFKRENVIELCIDSLRDMPDWKYAVQEQLNQGKSLELAWRANANLDWVWLEDDVTGKPRGWHVLCGLPFKQLALKPPILEIRVAEHAPTHVHLRNGRHVDEPPSIEGYVDRIRPNTQTKQQIYLSTHHGNLFILNPFAAFPPMPPGLAPVADLYTDAVTLRHSEIRRGTNQIMAATTVCDLRTIVADQEDEGGDGGLGKFSDRSRARVRRSFELLLNTGHVIRFEAHSCRVAIEWIERLRALVFYWKQRHRTDAKQEIELAQAQRPRLTPQTRVRDDNQDLPPEAPTDLSAPFAAMGSLYNWCALEGCSPIVKVGRLYMRKGLRGQYKLVQLFLVAGHLVRFGIGLSSSLYPSVRQKINLLDAYVCSGYFAAQCLPQGQFIPNAEPAPRRYQDGLETDDREEDMLFMIWYHPQPQMVNADQDPTVTPVTSKSVPGLSSKHKMLVFKTRSILERDAWCWAINSEIEKIVRAQKSREDKLRETGCLLKLSG